MGNSSVQISYLKSGGFEAKDNYLWGGVFRKKSFLSKESGTVIKSYSVYISPTRHASSALIQIESRQVW